MFVTTNVLPRQPYTSFVATKICFAVFAVTNICHGKNILSRETQFCRDNFVVVATSVLLTEEKTCFVATKIILVAAPANDKGGRGGGGGNYT